MYCYAVQFFSLEHFNVLIAILLRHSVLSFEPLLLNIAWIFLRPLITSKGVHLLDICDT